ncbi:MAG: M1 family metallopeptidase, partial [Flavobacteriales bacterium]|nr:M1 family metallopeptidase [Flavobacteriales bacterium]
IHLWPNAYKDHSTALCEQLDGMNEFGLHFATPEQRGYIDSLDFRSNDVKLEWGQDPENPDIGWIKLPKTLATGERITISTPFHVKIPSASFSRLGHAGQAYYITQWYPKPAVCDREGWHAMPYLTQGEFYSEFGSFDVRITLPANYVVGATGELQDKEERSWLDSLSAVPYADDENFYLRKQRSRLNSIPTSSIRTKTLRFKQDRVHDFAWFADKRFIVRKGSVSLPRSGSTVTTWTMFTPRNADIWKDAITYVNESVRLYSEWIGDYPYSACTAIDGGTAAGGGMEYPMITIINDSEDAFELDVVIAHEVGHNWFYGMLASNERDHPWMDEGINSFYEQRYVETRYPDKRIMDLQGIPLGFLTRHKGITYRQQNELQYRFNARRNWDSPLGSPSMDFAMLDYGTTVYSKGALVMAELRNELGTMGLDERMQAYFQRHCFKHPGPEDLKRSLNGPLSSVSDTIWDLLIHSNRKVDVRGSRRDGLHVATEIDPRNDAPGLRLPEVKFLGGLEREDRKSIYWTPVIGRNSHDGWMPGLLLHNTTLPNQRFEWVAAPLYGTKSERLAGGARFMWHHDRLRSDWFRNIHVGVSGFAASLWNVGEVEQWYQRAVPSLQLDLRSHPTAAQTD